MKEKKDQQQKRKTSYTGIGIALGAPLGLIFGLLLFDNNGLGIVLGAALGVVIGAIADVQTKNTQSKKK
jgi:uncharacterized membrane protein